MATITGTFNSLVSGSLSGVIGTPGPSGLSATISVGTTTTGAPGTNATVTNSGSSSAAVFNFTIPRGEVGATGPAGQTGATGAAGAAATISVGSTSTLSAGSNATVTNAGNSSSAIFNFGIPRGEVGPTGATGATGATGTAATIAVGTVSTGDAGSAVSITNSGTSSAAVFNFTIPRGNTGSQGAVGNTGPQGPQGVAGDKYATTSTSAMSISNGAKTLTVGTGLAYTPQQDIIIAHDSANHMHGVVTSYTSATGALIADIAQHSGSGTYTSWMVNLSGGAGIEGPQGPAGSAATISVGSVSTGAAGSSASVTNVGTTSAAVFDFSIPQGNQGDPGTPGVGVPAGGSAGMVLAKVDGVDYNTEWVTASGGSFNGGAVANPITIAGATYDSEMSSDFFGVELSSDTTQYAELEFNKLTVNDSTSNTTINTWGFASYDNASSFSIGSTLDYAGFNNFNGSVSTNIQPGNVTLYGSSTNLVLDSTGITFPDSTTQTTAAVTVTNNSQLGTTVNAFTATHYLDMADKNGIVLCQSGCATIYLTDSSAGWSVGQQVLIVNNSGSVVTISNSGSTSYISYNGGYLLGVSGCCAAVYIDTDLWVISGNLTT